MKFTLVLSLLLAAGSGAVLAADAEDHSHLPAPRKAARKAGPTETRAQMAARMNRVADELAKRVDHYWHEGDFESVAFLERQVVNLDPTDVSAWSNLGWIYWACLNDEREAEATLREGLAANPRRYELYDELGTYLYRRKRYGESAAALAKAVSFPNAHVTTWNSYAHALEKLGRNPRAAEVWRTMQAKFPGNPHSPVNLARMKRKGLLP